jgi:ferredoxin-NADP reductase
MNQRGRLMDDAAPRIVKVVKENQEIASVYIENYSESFKKRHAGSFLSLKIMEDGEWSKAHPFTISCAPEDPVLRATIKKAGPFTTRVHELKPGDPVQCAGPYGLFCKDIDAQPDIAIIAGGVGITPFLSVLRHFKNIQAKNKVFLVWSNRTLEDAFSVDELKQLTKDINLKFVFNLSREADSAGLAQYVDTDFPDVMYEPGRCTRDVMKKYSISVDKAVYLCGPPPMQDFIISELEAMGMDPKDIKKESFSWKGGK